MEENDINLDITISENLYKELQKVAEVTHCSMEDIITRALNSAVSPYRNETGVVTLNPALYIFANKEPQPCNVIEKTMIYGNIYCRIIVDGRVMSVPGECVKYS